MPKIKFNEANRPYYSDDFIKGFECGTERQYKADQKTGHWEEYGHNISDSYIWDGVRCSVCKKDARVKTRFIKRESVIWSRDCFVLARYCPHCGAKMEVKKK